MSEATTPNPEAHRVELSVILPAYNEAAAVSDAITQYATALPGVVDRFEIVIIDDGSTDDTLAVARQLASEMPHVRVLHNQRNLGQVASILRGFREARGDVLTHNGIDLPFDPAETGRLMAPFDEGADVVVVERTGRDAYSWVRKFISWSNILLVQTMFRSPMTDHNFVQAFRRQVIESVSVQSGGVSTVTTELILKSILTGFDVRAIAAPYCVRRSGHSSISAGKIWRTLGELFRLWFIMRSWKRQPRNRAANQNGRHRPEH